MKIYYPYKSDRKDKKYFIMTSDGRHIYFGSAGMNDFTIYSKTLPSNEANKKKEAYIRRHEKNENWNDPNTAAYWAKRYLWSYPTKSEAYENIKKDLKQKGYI